MGLTKTRRLSDYYKQKKSTAVTKRTMINRKSDECLDDNGDETIIPGNTNFDGKIFTSCSTSVTTTNSLSTNTMPTMSTSTVPTSTLLTSALPTPTCQSYGFQSFPVFNPGFTSTPFNQRTRPGIGINADQQNMYQQQKYLPPNAQANNAQPFDLQSLLTAVIRETVQSVSQQQRNVDQRSNYFDKQVSELIPDFNPKNSQVDDWLRKIDEYACAYNWSEQVTIFHALTKLKGIAKTWYDSMATVQRSWAEWKQLLKDAFPSTSNIQRTYQKMVDRKKRYEETNEEYFHEKVSLARKCGMDESNIIEFVIGGIQNENVISALSAREYLSLNELLVSLKRIEDRFPSKQRFTPKDKDKAKYSKNTNETAKNGNDSSMSRPSGSRKPATNEKGQPLCFNCEEYGHISVNCSQPQRRKRCVKCNKVGHLSAVCPDKHHYKSSNTFSKGTPGPTNTQTLHITEDQKTQSTESSTQFEKDSTVHMLHVTLPSREDGNSKYFHNATINGETFESYVDFGSKCVAIKEDVVKGLKLEKRDLEQPCSIGGYGNGRVDPLGWTEFDLTIDLATVKVSAYIVPDFVQQIPVLVGQPFTEHPSVTVVKRKGYIRFFHEDENTADDEGQLTSFVPPELPRRKISLRMKTQTILPPNYVGFLDVYTEGPTDGGDYFIDQCTRIRKNREHCIPSCVISVNESLTTRIPVLNNSTVDIIFRKDERIARAEICKQGKLPGDQAVLHTTEDELGLLPIEDMKINPKLEVDQHRRLVDLLQKYRDVFAVSAREMGEAKGVKMKIELTSDEPVTYRPYRLSYEEKKIVQEMVDELKECGIVVDANSPYSSPILLVKKKTGDYRLCVDYRALNKITKKDKYPLPLIDDQLERLSGNQYFTTLDLAMGYYQVPLEEDSQDCTAFTTPDGQYKFTRVPFGLVNASAVFQRVINTALGPLRYSVAMAFMDDLLIPGPTFDEALFNLEEVLKVLRRAGLRLKPGKCRFLSDNVEFLGYEISGDGITPGEHQLKSVENFPRPTNVHEVRRFLGLMSYFRKFIQNFAGRARSLTLLTKKNVLFRWEKEQEDAYQNLKKMLTERPVLATFTPGQPIELHTDASVDGLGAILLQEKDDNKLHPIYYASRQTTDCERRYHSYELEALAVVWSMEKFRPYLYGEEFTVVTDCASLQSTFSKKNIIPRIGRWWLRLQIFTFIVKHRMGTQMAHVDALSRSPWGPPEEMDVVQGVQVFSVEVDDDWLAIAQREDPILTDIMQRTKTGERIDNYVLEEGKLFYRVDDEENDLRWVVPKKVRWQITKKNHDDVGHFALDKTLALIRRKYWFPKMKRYVKGYIGACLSCLHHKQPAGKRQGELHSIDKVGKPFHTLHVDHLGPFIPSKGRNSYLIVVVDEFTKFVMMKAVKSAKTKPVIDYLQEVFSIFGAPHRLISDQGTAFTSHAFQKFCTDLHIIHVKNSTSTPRANGQVERYNRVIAPALASMIEKPDSRDWDQHVKQLQWGINNTVHKATKQTPFALLFNYVPKSITGDELGDELQQMFDRKIEEKRHKAIKDLRQDQEKQRMRYNAKRAKATQYQPGDLVVILRNPEATGQSLKLAPKYKGPYIVTEVLPNDRYRVEDLPELQRTQKFYSGTVPPDKMKRYQVFGDEELSSGTEDEEGSEVPLQPATSRDNSREEDFVNSAERDDQRSTTSENQKLRRSERKRRLVQRYKP